MEALRAMTQATSLQRDGDRTEASGAGTRVLIIDDHPMIYLGCRYLLGEASIKDIVVAQSGAEGFRLYRQKRPDVIIVDLSLPMGPLSGLSFVRRLRRQDERIPIIVLSMHSDPAVARRAISLGASAFVTKDAAGAELVTAFGKVLGGERFVSEQVATELSFLDDSASPLTTLSLRELEALSLLVAGCSHERAAGELHVSYKTLQNTVGALKRKLGARNLSELVNIGAVTLQKSLSRR